MAETFRLPNRRQRIAVIGRTGSGKTIAGLWHLSNFDFSRDPGVVIDYKTDEHIAAIPYVRYIGTSDTPEKPGLYVIQPEPEDESMRDFLTRIWKRGKNGRGTLVYLDEGYMIGENKRVEARFKTLLTQGRSLEIPLITLSQRPVWMTRFVWSESDFYQVFDIALADDRETVRRMMPPETQLDFPEYHSVYYDVAKRKLTYLSPVPNEAESLQKLEDKLKPKRKVI